MASILDVAIMLGKESTYGTAVTLTDAFEGKADSYQVVREYIESTGFRAGMEAMRSDRRVDITMGGSGSLEFDVLTTGFGFVLQAMCGSVSGPTQNDATAAYTTTATTTAADPNDSYTVQILRTDVSGTQQAYTHTGGVITGWSLSQDVGGLCVVNLDFDFQDVVTNVSAGTPAYATGVPFDWTQAKATLDSVDTDVKSMSVTADLGLNVDRRFLRQSNLKKQPIRGAVPAYSGEISMEYDGQVEYNDFIAGNIIPIIMTWTGSNIESTYDYELKVTMNACQYTGNEPVSNLSDLPMLTLPFVALDNGTDAVMTIEYTSTDTAL